jgi:hypothetical protein
VKQLVDRARETSRDRRRRGEGLGDLRQRPVDRRDDAGAVGVEPGDDGGNGPRGEVGQEIAEQMEAINASMKKQSHATESITESAQEMVALSEELQKAVARFTLAEQRASGLVAS